uniref:Ubiquitin-like protease family profile domain-containing protein n=1 Tax=Cucumis melo TaxID=3656 RepID=A0A9I9E7Q3_CUCME
MVSKPNQVVLAPFNPMGHWALLAINAYEDTVFYLDSLRTTSKETTRYCPLQVGSTTCGYYVMKYMREIVNRGSIVISDSIDTRKSYSQTELDEGVAIMKVYVLGMIYFWARKWPFLTLDSTTVLKPSRKLILDSLKPSKESVFVVVTEQKMNRKYTYGTKNERENNS